MIFTFYSYKGGVGRTMALANVADLFYQHGAKVLVIDWDLEAPGLEQFLLREGRTKDVLSKPGLMDMIQDYKKLARPPGGKKNTSPPPQKTNDFPPLEDYVQKLELDSSPNQGEIWLLSSGRRTDEHFEKYVHNVVSFDWSDFLKEWEGERYIEWLRKEFDEYADVVLIDSRTGVTEIGGICTYHLADAVVMLCAPGQQNLDGIYRMARTFARSGLEERRGRPLETLIVPARTADAGPPLTKFRDQFVERFDQFLPETLQPEIDSFWDLKIPYVSHYAFTETLVVREKPNGHIGATGMINAFKTLVKLIIRLDPVLLKNEHIMEFYVDNSSWDKIASLFDDDTLEGFYKTGKTTVVDDLIKRFPTQELDQRPRLRFLRGKILNDDFNQLDKAMFYFEEAERQFRHLKESVRVAEAQVWQSANLRMRGQAKKSLELVSKGLEKLRTLVPEDDYLIAWAIKNRGSAYGTAGHLVKALRDIQKALEYFESKKNKRMIGLCHHDIGVTLEKQGNISEAEKHYKKALNIWEELKNDIRRVNTLISLGNVLREADRYDEAEETLKESLRLAEQMGNHRRAAFAWEGLGETYQLRKQYQEAANAYAKSTEYADNLLIHSLVVSNEINVSECFFHHYQHQNPEETLERARHAREIATEYGLTFEKGQACLLEARIYIHLQQYPPSFELLDKAVAIFSESKATEQLIKCELWWIYGLLLDQKADEAVDHIDKALTLVPQINPSARRLKEEIVEIKQLFIPFINSKTVIVSVRNKISQLLEL